MELRAFAERILFATTLDEKLAAPAGKLTDEHPGPAILAPPAPGRPAELRFKPAGREMSAEFPGLDHLERERERGRLLHFFANHELLATELMALVLLRFPDAPAAFRRGVLRTLRDEQEHTRLYLKRMRACGVTFGELPVSGYFWRCVADMENPMDYVAGLSLTFEQANLDYARHFAQGFATVGDADTARLLEKIYHDEIGHVAYGLKWFRRWKNPTESDWEAFCRQLKFPLSPQRAKGLTLSFVAHPPPQKTPLPPAPAHPCRGELITSPPERGGPQGRDVLRDDVGGFNVAGRRAAGFDAGFIAELEVYARSRGRTPGVLLFNPSAEGFIARGMGYTPGTRQRQLAVDLAHLPMFLGRQDDIVLVPRRPRVEFLRELQHAGFALPEFVTDATTLAARKLGRFRPWAWAPDSVAQLAPLFPQVTGESRVPGQCFNPAIAQLYSKAWSAAFLRRWLEARDEPWLCTFDDVGVAVRTLDDALAAIDAIRARGHHRVVVKEALGLAGQNAIRLWEPEVLATQRRWIERAVATGGELVVECWLERVWDFSMQCEMTPRGLQLVGFTGLENDLAGRFQANWAAPNHARRLPAVVPSSFASPRDIADRLHRLFVDLRTALGAEFSRAGLLGPVGIDAFVYRAADGTCRLKPVVEINPRHTMGRVTLELMRHVSPGSYGRFRLVNHAAMRAVGVATFVDFAAKFAQRYPLVREGNPVPKIASGTMALSDPATVSTCLAVFEVTRTNAVESGTT